jgi:hypothetical protein
MSYKPGRGKSYWMLNSRFEIKQTENTGSEKSAKRIRVGNAFQSQDEAEQFRKYVMDLAQHGYYRNVPKPGFIATILTWLVYLFLIALVIAAICLVADFILWIYDIDPRLPKW